jgi:hypothetical protein
MRTTTPLTNRARTTIALAVGGGLTAILAACGATSGADEAAIASTEEWCDAAHEVDTIVGDRSSSNTIHHQLQDVYVEARGQVVELLDGLEHVDADQRAGVEAFGEAFLSLADAIIGAPDQAAAEASVAEVLDTIDPAAEAGADWVEQTCDVT